MAWRLGAFATVAAGVCLLVPARAFAAEELPVAVISIQTEDVLDQAEALTTAIKRTLRKTPGWSLQEGEWALEVLTVSLECAEPPDAACETKMGDQLKAERLIWGTLGKRDGATVTGQLHLWTRGQGSKSTTVTYSANLTEANDESLGQVADKALRELTGGSPDGTVRVRVGTITGQVFEDGRPVGTITGGQGTVTLPPGRHALTIRGEGTTDLETIVEVKPLTATEVVLQPQAAPSGPDWQKIAGFGSIGLGLGFAAVGVISSVRIGQLNDDLTQYRSEVPANEDVCEVANRRERSNDEQVIGICDTASTFETLQMVMYPLAAVSVGTGIVLLSTADWSGDAETGAAASHRAATPPAELVLSPRVGYGHGDVRLTYTF